jgi:hypothetical protein
VTTNHKILVASLSFAALLAGVPGTARAQGEAVGAAAAAPIIEKVIGVIAPKKDPPGTNWLKAQVLHADSHSMIVQEQANPKMIHTFTYGPELKDAMQSLENNGGFRYGDKIRILYEPGKQVALRIKGKPS